MTDISSAQAALIAAGVSLLAAAGAICLGIINFRLARSIKQAEVRIRINQQYDRLIEFRTSHPEVLKLSGLWTSSSLTKIYKQSSCDDLQWAIYYSYVELCLSFCNSALNGLKRGLYDQEAFEDHFKRLVRLVLTENEPFVSELINQKGFVPRSVLEFFRAEKEAGWNWKEEHKRMVRLNSAERVHAPNSPLSGLSSDR